MAGRIWFSHLNRYRRECNIEFMKINFFFLLLLYAFNGFAACEFDQQEERVALVIGNGDYDHIRSLKNPVNDARSISQVLRQYSFSVIERHNQTRDEMQQAINCFGNTLSEGGVGLLYYAGHGVQVGQHNFLIPKDFAIDENQTNGEKQIRDYAIDTNNIMGIFKLIKPDTNIIILDACRDNPFKTKTRSLKTSKLQRELASIAKNGLVEMAAPVGSYIAFATSPGDTSDDGDGENGLFTENLLRHLNNPNLDINSVFDSTAADVYKSSNKGQIPWRRSSLLNKFYFSPLKQTTPLSPDSAILNTPASPGFDKYFNQGKFYLYDKGRPEKAIGYFKQSQNFSKGNAEVYYHLGLAYLKLTNYAEAITHLQRTIKLNPGHSGAYRLLAKSYAALGDKETAAKFKRMAITGNRD